MVEALIKVLDRVTWPVAMVLCTGFACVVGSIHALTPMLSLVCTFLSQLTTSLLQLTGVIGSYPFASLCLCSAWTAWVLKDTMKNNFVAVLQSVEKCWISTVQICVPAIDAFLRMLLFVALVAAILSSFHLLAERQQLMYYQFETNKTNLQVEVTRNRMDLEDSYFNKANRGLLPWLFGPVKPVLLLQS